MTANRPILEIELAANAGQELDGVPPYLLRQVVLDCRLQLEMGPSYGQDRCIRCRTTGRVCKRVRFTRLPATAVWRCLSCHMLGVSCAMDPEFHCSWSAFNEGRIPNDDMPLVMRTNPPVAQRNSESMRG